MHSLARPFSLCFALLMAGCVSTPPDGLAERYGPIKGESEVTLSGSISRQSFSDSDFETTTLVTVAGLGHHLTDTWEAGGQVVGIYNNFDDGEEDEDFTVFGLFPYFRYNHRANERTTLYAGIHAGVIAFESDETSDSAFSYGAHVGWKSWLNPKVAFFLEPRITFFEIDDTDITDTSMLFGFSVLY